MWPSEIADRSPAAHLRIIQRLRRALREERRRGIAGDWAYDLARHWALYRALRAEMSRAPLPLSSWAVPPFDRRAGLPVPPAEQGAPGGAELAATTGRPAP
jgi:hypothetical protein